MATDFVIKIVAQGWLGSEPDAARTDLCSHGKLHIIIGGHTIEDGSEDYGVSETALALLRTLERDHNPAQPVAESFQGAPRLVFHGCGTILMMGCPIGIDWTVEHKPGGWVRLSNVRKFDTTSETPTVTFPGLAAEVGGKRYRAEVTRFAQEVKLFFANQAKTIQDDWDRQQDEEYWQEFDRLLAQYG